MYKKRLQRLNKNIALTKPQKQVNQLLGKSKVTKKARKQLFFSSAIVSAIKQKYTSSRSIKEKQFIMKLVQTNIKKYKMTYMAKYTFGMSSRKSLPKLIISGKSTIYSRKKHESISQRIGAVVKEFICRDDNSRVTTSETDTIT